MIIAKLAFIYLKKLNSFDSLFNSMSQSCHFSECFILKYVCWGCIRSRRLLLVIPTTAPRTCVQSVYPSNTCPICRGFDFSHTAYSVGDGFAAAKSLGNDLAVMDDSSATLFLCASPSGPLSVDLSRQFI